MKIAGLDAQGRLIVDKDGKREYLGITPEEYGLSELSDEELSRVLAAMLVQNDQYPVEEVILR